MKITQTQIRVLAETLASSIQKEKKEIFEAKLKELREKYSKDIAKFRKESFSIREKFEKNRLFASGSLYYKNVIDNYVEQSFKLIPEVEKFLNSYKIAVSVKSISDALIIQSIDAESLDKLLTEVKKKFL